MSAAGMLPPEAYAAALADLPGLGPVRLVALLSQDPPERAWQRVLCGEVRRPPPRGGEPGAGRRATWAEVAARNDTVGRWDAINRAGIHTSYLGSPEFPIRLAEDPEPPGVLFWRGDLGVCERPCAAIVGTRRCTGYGRSVATTLGRDLSDCGVCVVSGLALGIDGAAHQGALAAVDGAGPLGVAASGVDMPYPRRHSELWRQVIESGVVISETPPGRPAQAWRFPARNRLIAALSRVVVVIESYEAGGSMLTVAAAADRGIDVLAVPGPVTSPTSGGTNQLLHEGLAPARHAGDVLAALGDFRVWPPKVEPGAANSPPAQRSKKSPSRTPPGPGSESARLALTLAPPRGEPRHLDSQDRRVLESIDRTPTPTGTLADRTGLPIGALSMVLLRLEERGLVRGEGVCWERCG